ncbi:hypothetical protein N1851_022855 [Merluccius polli]|uniref:Uncharacterized protein n=1 Tax=Merluccius polli TaxID=89951 RepID=A0AA47MH66_MERPO|nr:hypothetical protein N1851_022855 [Merluccius polli]
MRHWCFVNIKESRCCGHWMDETIEAAAAAAPAEPTLARSLLPRPHLCSCMEAKAKSGAPTPKGAAVKVEKKEPAAPVVQKIFLQTENLPSNDEKVEAEAEATPEAEDAATSSTDSLDHLKPFLIGGAVVAMGAILLGVLLLARRN